MIDPLSCQPSCAITKQGAKEKITKSREIRIEFIGFDKLADLVKMIEDFGIYLHIKRS